MPGIQLCASGKSEEDLPKSWVHFHLSISRKMQNRHSSTRSSLCNQKTFGFQSSTTAGCPDSTRTTAWQGQCRLREKVEEAYVPGLTCPSRNRTDFVLELSLCARSGNTRNQTIYCWRSFHFRSWWDKLQMSCAVRPVLDSKRLPWWHCKKQLKHTWLDCLKTLTWLRSMPREWPSWPETSGLPGRFEVSYKLLHRTQHQIEWSIKKRMSTNELLARNQFAIGEVSAAAAAAAAPTEPLPSLMNVRATTEAPQRARRRNNNVLGAVPWFTAPE